MRYAHKIPGHTRAQRQPAHVHTVEQAAERLGLSRRTLVHWIESGLLKGSQIIPGAPWRVELTDEHLIEGLAAPVAPREINFESGPLVPIHEGMVAGDADAVAGGEVEEVGRGVMVLLFRGRQGGVEQCPVAYPRGSNLLRQLPPVDQHDGAGAEPDRLGSNKKRAADAALRTVGGGGLSAVDGAAASRRTSGAAYFSLVAAGAAGAAGAA